MTKKSRAYRKVTYKLESRYTEETSFVSTISFLVCIVTTHFFVGNPNIIYHKNNFSEASEGSKRLHKLLLRWNLGVPLYPVLPGLVILTDDTTVFAFKGTIKGVEKWYLLSGPGVNNDDRYYAVYSSETGGTDNINSLQAWLTSMLEVSQRHS